MAAQRPRWLVVLVAACGAREPERMLPTTLVVPDDIVVDGVDGDAGASLLRSGRYGELRELAMTEGLVQSVEFRNNAALTYLLEGDTLAADIAFSRLAAWCETRWNSSDFYGGARDFAGADALVLSPCLAIYKNWYWALAARPLPSDQSGLSATVRGLTNYLHADFELGEWAAILGDARLHDAAAGCGVGSAESPVAAPCEHPFGLTWRAAGVSGLSSGADGEEAERARRRYQTTLSVADLDHLERLVGRLFDDGVPGDLMEAGVFRGGACIFLRGLLAAAFPAEATRRVVVADSFAGIPPPRLDIEVAATGETHAKEVDPTADWTDRFVSGVDAVRYNFRRYGLLDGRDLRRGFNESLPPVLGSTSDVAPVPPPEGAPVLALLRIDADAYDGVLDALHGAYHRLSPGGAVVIDDWHLGGARAAVHKFRAARHIVAPLRPLPSDHAHVHAGPRGPRGLRGGGRGRAARRRAPPRLRPEQGPRRPHRPARRLLAQGLGRARPGS
ncbi:macrocin-O-methyltransferase [Aureococcus anophagefferens]|nr:macrocin-O-methyltransferase [Aureococcus anophagefferens]